MRAMGERPRSLELHDIVSLHRRPDFRQRTDLGERSSSRKATPQAYRFVHVRASRPDRCSVNLRAAEGICLRVSFRLLPTPHGSGPRRRTSSPRYMGLRHLRTSNRHHLERARRRGRCRPGGRQEMQVVWNPYDSPRSPIRRLSFPVVGPVGWLDLIHSV